MKTILWRAGLVVLGLATTLVWAHDDEQGGDIDGSEFLRQEVTLTATTNAPAGATGKVELEAENENGVTTAKLEVETEGLLPGDYEVRVILKSDGSEVVIGPLSAGHSEDDMDDDDGEADDDEQGEDEDENEDGEAEFGEDSDRPLPAGLNPMDLAGITIVHENGDVVLTGDFMDAGDTIQSCFKAKVAVTAGAAAPDASGLAKLQARRRHGVQMGYFRLQAKGVTPNAVLTLKINGVPQATVNTDRRGQLRMKALPAGVDAGSLIRMEFDDDAGRNALTISF